MTETPDATLSRFHWAASNQSDMNEIAARWIGAPALRELVVSLGGPAPHDLAVLLRWSEATLDTRGGAERHEAARVLWPRPRIDALLAAAEPLGLLHTSAPERTIYGATLILGGTSAGNRLRTELAAQSADRGVHLGTLVVLSANRPLTPREHEAEPDSASDTMEWESALRHADRAFGPLSPERDEHGGAGSASWMDRTLRGPDTPTVRLLVAPPRERRPRATTADGIAFALERIPLGAHRTVLLITSAIYAPYQFLSGAPLLLGGGIEWVELVGTPTQTDGDRSLLAQRLAQEIHAAIGAAVEVLSD